MAEVFYQADQVWNEHYGAGHEEYIFWCPGCESEHRVVIKWGAKTGRSQPQWTFNGNIEKPTIEPSYLLNSGPGMKDVCHSFIRDGQIQYLSDSTHKLSGQTVALTPKPKRAPKG